MGRLAGFKYQQIIKRLKQSGFEFDRQPARYNSWEDYWRNATRPSSDFVELMLKRDGDELPLEERG